MSANELQPNSTDFSDDYKEVDYNHEDYESIKNYMQSQGGECSVKNIKKCSGAHPLRIYPVLFRMEKENELEVIEQTLFGAGIGGNLSETFGIHTIWVSSVILMVSMVLMWYEKFRKYDKITKNTVFSPPDFW